MALVLLTLENLENLRTEGAIGKYKEDFSRDEPCVDFLKAKKQEPWTVLPSIGTLGDDEC